MKNVKPFWRVKANQAPEAFENFLTTPPLRRRFHVPILHHHPETDCLDACPECGSENIQDEDAPMDGVFQISCHDCSHQWTELAPY